MAYILEVGGKSRATAYYYMTKVGNRCFIDRAVEVLLTIIKHVMSSASETEIVSICYGYNRVMPYHITPKEMGNPHANHTPITTDNITAHGLVIFTMPSRPFKPNNMTFCGSNDGEHKACSNFSGPEDTHM